LDNADWRPMWTILRNKWIVCTQKKMIVSHHPSYLKNPKIIFPIHAASAIQVNINSKPTN
jgi:hypothetical protein